MGLSQLTYKASEEKTELQVATTSSPGVVNIISYDEYARENSAHVMEWGTFLLLSVVPIGIPYIQYTNSKAQYAKKKTA